MFKSLTGGDYFLLVFERLVFMGKPFPGESNLKLQNQITVLKEIKCFLLVDRAHFW